MEKTKLICKINSPDSDMEFTKGTEYEFTKVNDEEWVTLDDGGNAVRFWDPNIMFTNPNKE